jgi:hypothetical protein
MMLNIATLHIKLGNYSDAMDNYTEIMKNNPVVKTTLNLLLCDLSMERKPET